MESGENMSRAFLLLLIECNPKEERGMLRIGVLLASAAVIASCASKSTDIAAAYVSPTLYENLTCEQLAIEAQTVSSRAIAASGAQDKQAGQDQAAMAVGLVLFWPAMFLTKGDGAQAAEVSRLKGEMQAVEDASRRKGCDITFQKMGEKAKA